MAEGQQEYGEQRTLTVREIEAISDASSEKTVKRIFQELGIDTADPIETQRTFAMVFAARRMTDKIVVGAIMIATITIVGGAFSAIWLGFKAMLGRG